MSISEIQGRIAAIEARFGINSANGPGGVLGQQSSSTAEASATGTSTDTSFADALATLTGQKTSSTNSSGNTSGLGALINSLGGATTSTPTGSQVITEAKKYLGVPYVWGGESRSGMDCSGLTQTVFEKFGIDLPRTSSQQARAGVAVNGLSNAKPGDLLFFHSPVSHVGIYVGDGKMINAPHRGAEVRIEKVWSSLTSVRRVLPETSSVVGSTTSAPATTPGGAGLSVDGVPAQYARLFTTAGAKHGISANLLAAVAKIESNFDPTAVSSAGARGLMQFMPGTAAGLDINPYNPAEAVDGAARLLKGYLKKYDGSLELSLAAYNAGPGAVKRYGGVPPYTETQAYVRKVKAAMS